MKSVYVQLMNQLYDKRFGSRTLIFGMLLFTLQGCPLANFYKKYGAFGSPEDPASAIAPVIRILNEVNQQLRRDVENLTTGKAGLTKNINSLAVIGIGITPLRALWTKEKVSITGDTFNLMSRSGSYDAFIKEIDKLVDLSIANWEGPFFGITKITTLNTSNCIYDFFNDMHLTEEQMTEELRNLKTQSEKAFLRKRISIANGVTKKLEAGIKEYLTFRTAISYANQSKSAQSAAALTLELLNDLAQERLKVTDGSFVMTKEKLASIWDAPISDEAAFVKRICTGLIDMYPLTEATHQTAKKFFTEDTGFSTLLTNTTLNDVNKKMDEFTKAVWLTTGKGVPSNLGNYEYRLQVAICGTFGVELAGQGALSLPAAADPVDPAVVAAPPVAK